jgi:hypothetical protein
LKFHNKKKHFLSYLQKKETSSPPIINGNGFGGTDFFPEKPASNGQQQLFSDDIFSLATPSPQLQNVFDTSAPKR